MIRFQALNIQMLEHVMINYIFISLFIPPEIIILILKGDLVWL